MVDRGMAVSLCSGRGAVQRAGCRVPAWPGHCAPCRAVPCRAVRPKATHSASLAEGGRLCRLPGRNVVVRRSGCARLHPGAACALGGRVVARDAKHCKLRRKKRKGGGRR